MNIVLALASMSVVGMLTFPVRAQNLLTGPNTVSFTATAGGANPPAQTVVVNHTGNTAKQYTVAVSTAVGGNWLSASQSAGVTPSRFTLAANPLGLPPGVYAGTVLITSQGVPQAKVDVTLSVVTTPQLSASPNTLSFSRPVTGDIPNDEQLLLVNSTGSPVNFTTSTTTTDGGSWLLATTTTSTSPGVVSVRINSGGLAAGTYNGTVRVTAQGLNTITVPVTLVVSGSPFLSANPAAVNIVAARNGAPTTQSVAIQTTSGTVPFTVNPTTTNGGNWLIVSPLNASAPGNLDVSVNPAGLPAGIFSGAIQITAPGTANNGITVPVTFTVTDLPIINATPRSFSVNLPDATLTNRLVRDLPAIQVTSATAGVNYSVAAATSNGGPWLTVGPASGAAPGEFGGQVDATGLVPGTYLGTITVTGPGNSIVIPVTLRVSSSAQITVDQPTVTFNLQKGQTPPSNQVVSIASTGASFAYQTAISNITPAGATWLNGAASSGNTPGTITLGVNAAAASALANGQYTATIGVSGQPGSTPALASPTNVNVVLNVSETPLFNVSPATMDFTVPVGAASPPIRPLAVTTTDNSSRPFTATSTTTSGGTWLLVGPNAGSTPSNISVSVIPQNLGVGVYEGIISITVPSISATAQNVRVRLIVQPAATLGASPTALTFTQSSGGAAPASQTINLTGSAGSGNYTATTSTVNGGAWLTVTPSGGTLPGAINVSVNGANLAAGTYNGSIGIASGDVNNSPITIPVSLTVTAAGLTLTPTSINLTALPGATTAVSQQLAIAAGGAVTAFTATSGTTSGGNWLSISSTGGTTPANITVTANPTGLSAGIYNGSVTVNAPGVLNSPQTVPVTFVISTTPVAGRQLLSQIADGAGWKTTIILVNLDREPAPFTLKFYTGTGAALRLPIEGSVGRLESLEGIIPVGGSRTILTAGTDAALAQGWAELTSSRSISGLGVFRQRVEGRPDQEAGVTATTPTTRFVLPFDNTQGFVSSMALVNTNTTQSRATTVTPRDEAGTALTGNAVNLPPLGHNAFVMSDQFPSMTGRRGSAEFASAAPDFSALGLRFNPSGAFTSLPALPVTSAAPLLTQVISQVADGSGWKTSITLVNLDTVPAPFTLRFWRQNGSALPVPILGAATTEVVEGTIPVGGTRVIESQGGTSELIQGWAELSTTRSISGLAVFRQRVTGRSDQEAAVSLTATGGRFILPFDNTDNFVTSMALVNSSATLGSTISVIIRDEAGVQIGTDSITLNGRGHTAFTLTDRFNVSRNRRGTAEFSSSNAQITGLGLRFNPGGAFTSFPVLPVN